MMKEKTNVPWRKQPKGCPYGEDILNNEQYLKDRKQMFHENGHGWWWGWTSFNCPVIGMRPQLKAEEIIRYKKKEEEKEN